jgi:cellulose biosynthesis protein BcsQ
MAIIKQKRVLIIDADPQCNATSYLLPEQTLLEFYESSYHETIESFLDPLRHGKGYKANPITLQHSGRFELDLIPGDPKFALSEDFLAQDWIQGKAGAARGLQTTFVFRNIISSYNEYDYIFIDVGPSLGAINRAVLLGSQYFIVPMSSDIFSLMAINNIARSLNEWKRSLEKGLEEYRQEEGTDYTIGNDRAIWRLKFAGYVLQQYTAKTNEGQRRPVGAYEKILRQVPRVIEKELINQFTDPSNLVDYKLGEIPNLHSIVPMSQTAKTPIFALKARDGVVGAHFAKVDEAKEIYKKIAQQLAVNLGEI